MVQVIRQSPAADLAEVRHEVSGAGRHPFGTWVHGHQYDLNTLVGPSNVDLTVAQSINDRGQIVALGQLANGNQHFSC